MEVAYAIFVLFCVGIVPAASVIISTIARVHHYRKKGNSLKLQYHISDILAATFCLGATVAITHSIFQYESATPFVIYFAIAAIFGMLAGKIWHLTSVENSLGHGAIYIAFGTVLWTVAAAGSFLMIALLRFRGGGCC